MAYATLTVTGRLAPIMIGAESAGELQASSQQIRSPVPKPLRIIIRPAMHPSA